MANELTYQSEFTGQQMDAKFTAVAELQAAITELQAAVNAKYSKPSAGIPSTDLDADVNAALAKANSAIQSLADYYTKAEVDALIATINGQEYVDVSSLPTASASTMGKIYLVGPDGSGYYSYYYTSYDGSAYSWVGPLGTTQISLANYATKAELSQLDQEVETAVDIADKVFKLKHWNLAEDAEILVGKVFDGNSESNNAGFFIVKGCIVPSGTTTVYFNSSYYAGTYSSTGYNNKYSARQLRFRDKNGELISIDTATARSPYSSVPTGTKYVDVLFALNSGETGTYFVTINAENQHQDKYIFKQYPFGIVGSQGIKVTKDEQEVFTIEGNSALGNVTKLYPKTKLPVVCFTFDDLSVSDELVVELFDNKKLTCGFAYVSGVPAWADKYERYKDLQRRGYQILNHGSIKITGSGASKSLTTENYTYSEAMGVILESLQNIKDFGLVCNGWVTPDAIFDASFQPIIELSHAYCFPFTNQVNANLRNSDIGHLRRRTLQNYTLAEIEAMVDDAITNDELLVFYGHSANLVDGGGVNDFSIAQLDAVLDYCIEKRDAGQIYLTGVDDGVKYYYGL